jgi:disulfide oxidoreductase YuzD
VVRKIKIRLFVAHQICVCSTDGPDCCPAPGESEKEISELTEAIKKDFPAREIEVKEIRDIKMLEKFPQAIGLFKKYGYNALPIIMLGDKVVAYGIPDKEFIINSIKKSKENDKSK